MLFRVCKNYFLNVFVARTLPSNINPITAPACKIPGLKVHGRPCKQSTFWLYITSTFSAVCFDDSPFTCQREKG